MEHFKDDLNWDFKANKSLRVIIVGAGIAGLAAGIGARVNRSLTRSLLIDLKASSALGTMWSSSSKFPR